MQPKIELLQQNLQRLERLEKRLMRGRSQRKKSNMCKQQQEEGENIEKFNKKSKSKKKNWRFAYDLYCKELLTNGQNCSNTHRSNEREAAPYYLRSKQGSRGERITLQEQLANQTTYPRHTHSNSFSRKELVARRTAASRESNEHAATLVGERMVT